MVLSPGTRLGPYGVTARIGAGGMGEVYRARGSDGRFLINRVLDDAVPITLVQNWTVHR